jgi:hypothetical protein
MESVVSSDRIKEIIKIDVSAGDNWAELKKLKIA